MGDVRRLAALGMATELAKEVVNQMDSEGADGVTSVNGQSGAVTLGADDVGALPDSYTPPAPAWGDVTGKPAVIAAGADQSAARTAIGAGTSNLTLTQAQAGIATKPEIAALTAESTVADVVAALQA